MTEMTVEAIQAHREYQNQREWILTLPTAKAWGFSVYP